MKKTIWQRYNKFAEETVEYLNRWYRTSNFSVRSISLLVIMVLSAGGLLFWSSQFDNAFTIYSGNQGELELAKSGLQTMKRMVSDQTAWSEAVKEEYNRIITRERSMYFSYQDNFVGSNNSIDQVLPK